MLQYSDVCLFQCLQRVFIKAIIGHDDVDQLGRKKMSGTDGVDLAGVQQNNQLVRMGSQSLQQVPGIAAATNEAMLRTKIVGAENRVIEMHGIDRSEKAGAMGTEGAGVQLAAKHGCLDVGMFGKFHGGSDSIGKKLHLNIWQYLCQCNAGGAGSKINGQIRLHQTCCLLGNQVFGFGVDRNAGVKIIDHADGGR